MLARNTILHGRYRIVRPLGKGGMGQVYEAIDDTIDSIVAIKETFANTERLRNAFEREGKLLANLKHPVLPRVTHHFVQGNGQFLVMEFIDGHSLAQLLDLRGRAFGYDAVLPWTEKLLDALSYLHRQPEPIIHRDIKPANIKVTGKGEVYLLDFGLAKGAAGQETSSVHGYTAAYAPLEQLNNSGTTPQSDLYSLGATLYHLLTGELPEPASRRNRVIEETGHDPLLSLHQLNPDVPDAVSTIILCSMSIKQKDRFASAAEMSAALRDVASTMEREREKILDLPTLRVEKPEIVPGPTEAAVKVSDPNLTREHRAKPKDAYLKTLTTPPPVVPPPPSSGQVAQPSWPSQNDSVPSFEGASYGHEETKTSQAKPRLPGIFVSYRREDSSGHAGRLSDKLLDQFGKDRIFMDIDTIEPGEDYVDVIEHAVGACDILIAIIGRRWLSVSDETSRRLDNPNDFVRLEIAAALNRNIRVIPVLVQGASMPKARDLPDDLSRFARKNALELSDLRWRHDVDQLVNVLERILAKREDERQRLAAEQRRKKQEQEEEKKRRQAAEEEARRAAEEAKKRAEEERLREEGAASRLAAEEAARRAEAERRRREEVERLKREAEEQEARRFAEEAARIKAQQEAARRAEAERQRREEAERQQREAEEKEAGRRAEEAARVRVEEEKARAAEEARKREEARVKEELREHEIQEATLLAEEQRKREEAERQRIAAEKQQRKKEERKRLEAEELRKQADEQKRLQAAEEARRDELERLRRAERAEQDRRGKPKRSVRWKIAMASTAVAGAGLLIAIGIGVRWLGSHRDTTKLPPQPPPGMAYIPGGTFMMGRDDVDDLWQRPAHQVTVKPFFMDINDVTQAEYKKCVDEHGCSPPIGWTNGTYPEGTARHPVTGVTWNAANDYARWAGKRLPTEEEWEFAARGPEGLRYPWGDHWKKNAANAGDSSKGHVVDVDSYPDGKSPFGVMGMAGNAWQWTATTKVLYPGYPGATPPERYSKTSDNAKIIRGGTFENDIDKVTTTYRRAYDPTDEADYTRMSFRCVKDAQ